MIHVAILKPGYIRQILAGTKTIESRLSKTAQPPYGKIAAGERLFIKASGGPFMATALAQQVHFAKDITPGDVARYQELVGGEPDYWDAKRASRYATLVTLAEVQAITVGPKYKPAYMRAWYVLDEKLSPLRDWKITGGGIRNHYAMLPKAKGSNKKPGTSITLLLPGGEAVRTDLAKGRMLRWRGWGGVYSDAGAKPGDVLRFVAMGPGRFAVQVVRAR